MQLVVLLASVLLMGLIERSLRFMRIVMRWLLTAVLPAVASLMAPVANAEERKLYEWTVYTSPSVGTVNEVVIDSMSATLILRCAQRVLVRLAVAIWELSNAPQRRQ